MIYPLVIKHVNRKSPMNGGCITKITNKRSIFQPAMFDYQRVYIDAYNRLRYTPISTCPNISKELGVHWAANVIANNDLGGRQHEGNGT